MQPEASAANALMIRFLEVDIFIRAFLLLLIQSTYSDNVWLPILIICGGRYYFLFTGFTFQSFHPFLLLGNGWEINKYK